MKRKSKTLIIFWLSLILISSYLIFFVDWVGYDEITERIDERNEVQLYEGQELIGIINNVQTEEFQDPSAFPFFLYYDLKNDDLITKSPHPTGFGMINDETEFIFESGKTVSGLDDLLRYLYFGMRVKTVISINEDNKLEEQNHARNPHFIQSVYLFDKSSNNAAVKDVLSDHQEKVTVVSFFDKRNDTHSFLHNINQLYPDFIEDVQFFDINYANTLNILKEYGIKETPTVGVFDNTGLLYQTNDTEKLFAHLTKLSD